MHDSLGCSSAHSINDLGEHLMQRAVESPEIPATQTALFYICMNKKPNMCISYDRKKGFKILLCKAVNAFLSEILKPMQPSLRLDLLALG